jgi:superfamily II DNA or RNA helicase
MTTLYKHQSEAIRAIEDYDDDCVVKMFCGSGKSRVMLTYALKHTGFKVFVFPSLSLISQFRSDYLENPIWCVNQPTFYVCSDDISTTDEHEIHEFVSTTENKMVCVTYQSFEKFIGILDGDEPDLVVFDEAHHVIEDRVAHIIFGLKSRKIYFTATPRSNSEYSMEEDGDCGPTVYSYTHHDGVIDDVLNDFSICVDFSCENTNESIYDSIARTVVKTGNNRVLTFHQTVDTDSDTCVRNFVDVKKLRASFAKFSHKFTSIDFFQLDASTKAQDRKDILEKFEHARSDQVVVTSSCRTIGEGVDTKKANMVVFVDPKNSLTEIIQNIGRIVRKQDKPSTILIPCWVDKAKYEACSNPEECDKVIREDINKNGNFNGILNVVSALRQGDSELYELCLRYPDVFTRDEMKKNFEKQGVKNTEIPPISQKQFEKVVQGCPDARIEVHTHQVDNPIEVIHPEATKENLTFYRDDENVYHQLETKKKNIVPPRRRLFDVHKSDDIRVDWNITEQSFGNACIECTVKYDPMKKAIEFVQWVRDHNDNLPSRESDDHIEKSFGSTLSNWKSGLRGVGAGRLRENVKEYLDTELPGWSDKRIGEEAAMKKAIEIVQWIKSHDGCFPSTVSEDTVEKGFGVKLSAWRVDRYKLYESVKEYLSTEIPGWNETREEAAMKKATEIVQWVKEHAGRLPSNGSKDKIEKGFGMKLSNWKESLKGKLPGSVKKSNLGNLPDSVKKYIDTELPGWNETLEEASMKKAIEIVQWVEKHDGKLPSKESDDYIEKSFGQKLSSWKSALKGKGKSKLPQSVKEYLDTKIPIWSVSLAGEEASMKKAIEIVQWVKEHDGKRPNGHSKDPIEKSFSGRLSGWQQSLKGKGTSKLSTSVKQYLDTELPGWSEGISKFKLHQPTCPHVWEVINQDDEYHYKKCKSCGRRSKSSCAAQIAGYTASNPEKKLEINTWFSTQEFIPGTAIVLDADDMKTCHLLPFDPSDIVVPEYDDETFESNSNDPRFGECLRNGDFLEVLKSIDPSKLSLVYADFTGHFSKWTQPLLEYLSTVSSELRPGVILGVTWSENGDKREHGSHLKTLGKFEEKNNWTSINDSPADLHYGKGSNMCVDFFRK